MTTSSKLTAEILHLSSFLAYDTLPNHQDIVTSVNHGVSGVAVVNMRFLAGGDWALTLNLIVVYQVHRLRTWHLIVLCASLSLNANLFLLTAAHEWHYPNGALLNGVSAILISYSSASLVVCFDSNNVTNIWGGY